MAAARTLARRRMGACETTPPTSAGNQHTTLISQPQPTPSPPPRIFRRSPASSSFVLAAARLRALQLDPWRLARAARASTAEEFERILTGAAEEEAPDDFDWVFHYLDVGVAGLTLVLSAASYATCYSCRVHPEVAGDYPPQVIMAAELPRVRVLARYAAPVDCGVEIMEDGLVCVYATSVEHIHSLAEMMLAAQVELAELLPPSWRPRVQEFLDCEDPEEFEWAGDEMG